jgi:hypothetical protein
MGTERWHGGNQQYAFVGRTPDVNRSGIGVAYSGYNMFHHRAENRIELTEHGQHPTAPSLAQIEEFRSDLTKAARTHPDVALYLDRFPGLRLRNEEPMAETLMRSTG